MADTLRSILRRWYIFVTGVVLSLALGWTAYQTIPTTHEVSGSVILMPSDVTVGDNGNPFLYLGGMTNAVDVLIRRANAPEIRDDLLDRFDGADYTISRDLTTESPLAVVSVSAPTATMATELRDTGLTVIEQNLDAMQEELDIEPGLRISLRDVVVEVEATENSKTAIQIALLAIAAGLMGTFLLTGMIDGILTRRRGQAKAGPQASSHRESRSGALAAADGHRHDEDAAVPSLPAELFVDGVDPTTQQLAESRS